jgi:uncharacterized protein (DUF4415 family)
MKKKTDSRSTLPDDDNPEWTAADVASALSAAKALPNYIGEAATLDLMRRGRGRPEKVDKKIKQTLCLDADVLDAYRQNGLGWQTRIKQVPRDHMPDRMKQTASPKVRVGK